MRMKLFVLENWKKLFNSEYLKSATGYLVLKMGVSGVCGLTTQYLLTRHLAVSDFGLLVWANVIISMLSPFGLPGVSTSIRGAVAKGFDGNLRRGALQEVIGGAVGGLILIVFSIYYIFWGHDVQKALMLLVAGLLASGLWLDVHQCYWNGRRDFRALFIWTAIVNVVQVGFLALLLIITQEPVVIFCLQVIILVLGNFIPTFFIIKFGNINREISIEYEKFGWFSSKLYWIGAITSQLDKLIIGAFWGVEQLAVFTVGEFIYIYFYRTPAAFLSQVFHPQLAAMESTRQAALWIRKWEPYLLFITLIFLAVTAILIKPIYNFMFSEKYSSSIYYSYLFLLCILLGAPTILSGTLLKAKAMSQETMNSWAVLSFAPLVLVPLLGWLYGLSGIILSRGITNGLVSVYYNRMLKNAALRS